MVIPLRQKVIREIYDHFLPEDFLYPRDRVPTADEKQTDVHLVLVVPFLTTLAYKQIQDEIEYNEQAELKDPKLRIHIKLYNSRIIPLMSQLPLKESHAKLLQEVIERRNDKVNPLELGLAVSSDWKLPDMISLPQILHGVVPWRLMRQVETISDADLTDVWSLLAGVWSLLKDLVSTPKPQYLSKGKPIEESRQIVPLLPNPTPPTINILF